MLDESLTWLSRFEVCIDSEFYQCFDHAWRPVIHVESWLVCAQRPSDSVEVCVRLHPGFQALAPTYAARRIAGHLRDAATLSGHLPPPGSGDQPPS